MKNSIAQLDLVFVAQKRQSAALKRVSRNAERTTPGWNDDALEQVRQYALDHKEFTAEAMRTGKTAHDGRAWGPVMKRAAKEGYIISIGAEKVASSNLSYKTLWKSLVYRGVA